MIKNRKEILLDIVPIIVLLTLGYLTAAAFWPLMINADSYAILLPAKFLAEKGSFSAQLGNGGDLFMPLFYRGGFSLAIYFFSELFGLDFWLAAKLIIQSTYYLSIIVIYYFVKFLIETYFEKNNSKQKFLIKMLVPFSAGCLLISSYSFKNWSTVLMSETPTIFLVLLAGLLLFKSRANIIYYLLSAITIGIAMIFRLEMVIYLICFAYISLYFKNMKYWRVLLYLVIALFLWAAYCYWLYSSNIDPNAWLEQQKFIIEQLIGYHKLFLYFGAFLLVILLFLDKWPFLSWIPVLLACFFISKLSIGWKSDLLPFYSYFTHEWVLLITAAAGMIGLLITNRRFALPWLMALLSLLALYFTRGEYRYYVYLTPITVLMASLCFASLINIVLRKEKNIVFGKIFFIVIFCLLIIGGQLYLSEKESFLPKLSYEQVLIEKTQIIIKERKMDNILICSMFSEAFYYYTQKPVMDCFDGFNDIKRNKEIRKLVIVDEDMSRHQTEFVKYLQENNSQNLIQEEWIVTPYIEKNETTIPQYPVRWYLF